MGPVRADRLVALLNLLQTRGHITAAEAAEELEVSERTARRDLEALGMAGIPVYSQQGRNGGWRLLGGGRTDLSGLTSAEARALFLVAGPASTATPEVRAALRKLVRALPEPFREDAEKASTAIVTDPNAWGQRTRERPPPPHLDEVQQAVIDGEQLWLGYVGRDGQATERIVHPLGLAAKGRTWYLVAETEAGRRTFRVDRITSVRRTGQPVVRPPDFDLADAWRSVTERVESEAHVWATARATPHIIGPLRWTFGSKLRIGPTSDDGRIEVEVGGWHSHLLAAQVAGFGADVLVTGPPEVLTELATIAEELVGLYTALPAGT